MKRLNIWLFCSLLSFLVACNAPAADNTNKDKAKEETTELEKTDSLTSEIEKVQAEIETKSVELDEALEGLD